MTDSESLDDEAPRRRWLRPALLVLLLVVVASYPIGMLWLEEIDDNPNFSIADNAVPSNGSRAVAMASALIEREVDIHEWVANDPWFRPGATLGNMANFQQGIVRALARFAFELTDQLGRSRGSSQADKDLQEAAGLLQTSGDKWIFDLSTSVLPASSAEAQYRKARRSLDNYNQRLSRGEAVFDRRGDNLIATLDRVALDLGSSSAVLDSQITGHSHDTVDLDADDVFFVIKGQAYGYYMLLRELKQDFQLILRDREAGNVYDQMLISLRNVATMRPLIVFNGPPDSSFLPSHLAAEGFYLLRARTQLQEVSNILTK